MHSPYVLGSMLATAVWTGAFGLGFVTGRYVESRNKPLQPRTQPSCAHPAPEEAERVYRELMMGWWPPTQ